MTNLNLSLLEAQIEEFIEVSGDDVSSVTNLDTALSFSHVSLFTQVFSYVVNVYDNGTIELTQQVSKSKKSALDSNIENSIAETLTETVVVKTAKVANIQDVIAFVMSA